MKATKKKHLSLAISICPILLIGLWLGTPAIAEEAPANYSGDFWLRPALTGDWGGVRNALARKGIAFDITFTQAGMGVVSGGKDRGWEYGGRGNVTLDVDTQKLGLWPGGFLMMEAEGNFGNDVNPDTGALMPVDTGHLFPMPGENELNIPALTLTQFLSHYFGVVLGKIDTTSGDANEFAHGKGDGQFMNMAFNITPAGSLVITNSALGAGLVILPTRDPGAAVITALVLDSNGRANRSGFDTAFEGNNTYAAEGRVRTSFFGLTGHQLVGAAYSGSEFTSLDQSLRLIIETMTIGKKDGSWCFYYNFDQYLYEPKKGSGSGIGIFGRFGVTDGNPNPIHHFYSVGIGGKGMISSRPLDGFGLGYYLIDAGHPKFAGLQETREFLRNEYGVEAYYNFAITPWMKLTPDLQVVRGAQEKTVSVESLLPTVITQEEIRTATVLGLRLQLIF